MKYQIYEIGCEEYPKAYIGYTKKRNLMQRLYEHRSMFKNREKDSYKSMKTTCHEIFQNVSNPKSIKIKLIEEVETENKKDATNREDFHIMANKDRIVNKNRSIRTKMDKTPTKDIEVE
jgi:hypothetical protein